MPTTAAHLARIDTSQTPLGSKDDVWPKLIRIDQIEEIAGPSQTIRGQLLQIWKPLGGAENGDPLGESNLAKAQVQLASAQQQSAAFQTALETLRRQTGWLAQVAGYHIGYAGKPREVEVSAKEQTDSQALSKWLSNELGRPITIPRNLPMQGGLTFVGGRVVYTIDGQPIGQIAYHDSEGRLTAFCLKRNPDRVANEDLKQAQFFGRLQMTHWQDEVFQYAVVGFADFGRLEPVAIWLRNSYGEDT